MQDDLNGRTTVRDTSTGISSGMVMALVAAVLIIGSLFMFGPRNSSSHNGTASTTSSGTTTGMSTARPTPITPPAPAPANR